MTDAPTIEFYVLKVKSGFHAVLDKFSTLESHKLHAWAMTIRCGFIQSETALNPG